MGAKVGEVEEARDPGEKGQQVSFCRFLVVANRMVLVGVKVLLVDEYVGGDIYCRVMNGGDCLIGGYGGEANGVLVNCGEMNSGECLAGDKVKYLVDGKAGHVGGWWRRKK